ncbi:sulfite exporter TauE/SafE family protein [Pradoshia sp.]
MNYILIYLIGFIATTVGTLAGGGGFISFPSMLLLGVPIHSAIGANKVSNTVSSFTSFWHLYRKGEVDWKESIWIMPVSVMGGVAGGMTATFMSASMLTVVASIFLVFGYIISFLGKGNFTNQKEKLPLNKYSFSGLFGIGMFDGMFGPGQGTLLFNLFGYLNLSYIKAVALVRLATVSSCMGAAVTYIASDKIIWSVTLCLMLGSVTGAQLGVRIAEKLKPQYVKPILRIMTLLLLIQLWINQFNL